MITYHTLTVQALPKALLCALLLHSATFKAVAAQTVATPTVGAASASSQTDSEPTATSTSDDCEYNGSVTDYLSCAKDKISTTALIGAGIGVTLGIFALAFLCIWLTKRKRANVANRDRERQSNVDEGELEGRRMSNHNVPKITWDGAPEKGQDEGVEKDRDLKRRQSGLPPVPPVLDLKRSNTQRNQHQGTNPSERSGPGHSRSNSATSQVFQRSMNVQTDPRAARVEDATSSSDVRAWRPSRRIPPPSILKDATSGQSPNRASVLSHSRSISDTASIRRPEAAHLQAPGERPGTEFLQVPDARARRRTQSQMRRPSTVHSHSQPFPPPVQDQKANPTPAPTAKDEKVPNPTLHKPVPPRAQPQPIPAADASSTAPAQSGSDSGAPLISRSGSPIPPISPRTLFVSNASDRSSKVSSVYAPSVAASSLSSISGSSLPPSQVPTRPSLLTRSAKNLPQSQGQDQVQAQPRPISRASTISSHAAMPQVHESQPPVPLPVPVPVPGSHNGKKLPLRGVSTSAVRPISTASTIALPTPGFPDSGRADKPLQGIPEVPRQMSVSSQPSTSTSRTPPPARAPTLSDNPTQGAHVAQATQGLQAPSEPRTRTPSPSSSVTSTSRKKRETMMVPPTEAQRVSLMVDANGPGRSSTAMPSLDTARRSTLVVPGTEGHSRGDGSVRSGGSRSRSPSPAPSSVSQYSAACANSRVSPTRQSSAASSEQTAGGVNTTRPLKPRTNTGSGSSSNRTSLLPYMNSSVTKPERSGTTPLPIRENSLNKQSHKPQPQRNRTEFMPTQYDVSRRPSVSVSPDKLVRSRTPATKVEARTDYTQLHSESGSGSSGGERGSTASQAAASNTNRV
ncbi:hypothetical protein IAT40_001171 [Kwoniella sp. CBS 6097]